MDWDRKKTIRLVVFLAALVVAVGAFTAAVMGFTHRDSGYHEIEYTPESNAVLYGSGVHLLYYAAGSSADIRATVNFVQKLFSESLLRAYQLMDEKNTYEGLVNLASLNQNPGQWLPLDPLLEAALEDALEKTQRQEGYSLYAGPLHREWEILRYLEDPAPADPALNPEEAALLSEWTALLNQPGTFSLEMKDGQARLQVSDSYLAWAREREIDAPVLSLNLMKDAYLLTAVGDALTKAGYTAGYLYTDHGLSVILQGLGETEFRLLGLDGGEAREIGQVRLSAPAVFCQTTAFPPAGQRYGYYAVKDGANTYLRHPFLDARTGGFRDVVSGVALAGPWEDAAEWWYQALRFHGLETRQSALNALAALDASVFAACSFQGEERALYLHPAENCPFAMTEEGWQALVGSP